jgi:lambda family phage minor tail protein L
MGYTSVYPPEHTDTYVKATSNNGSEMPYHATNPAKSVTGSWIAKAWRSTANANTNQRFHIDLGEAKTVTRIYYENQHHWGSITTYGVKNFTFWGSNSADSFAELTYGTDTGWTQIATAQSIFDRHVAVNQADPKYITVTNSTAYRYYAFKFADNYGSAEGMGCRRIELQILDKYTVTFTEQNSLDDVGIAIYSDAEKTVEVTGSPITTAGGGIATIDISNGTYYYTASKSGYSDCEGDFTISDDIVGENFTMTLAEYAVTFTESNNLNNVSIAIYNDEAKTSEVSGSPITTNGSGVATIELPDGAYYYTASKTAYDNTTGSFTVSGAVVIESFTMSATVTFTREKNKLESSQVIHLYKFEYSSGGSLYNLYLADYDTNVQFPSGGQTYYASAVKHDQLQESRDGQVSQVTISVANVDRVIGSYVDENDGFRGRPLTIKTVFANHLNDASAYIEEKFTVDGATIAEDTCQLTCTSRMDVMNVNIPRRRFVNYCQWVFKSTECGYAGAETSCNKSFARCQALDNEERYGGFFVDGRTRLWF